MASLALLTLEVALTRIFSVLLWYHFAFLAISLALFGLAGGGLLLHFRPERFPREEVHRQMAMWSIFFALSVPVSYMLILGVPFVYRVSLPAVISLFLIYSFAALPFLFGGVVIALALSRFSHRITAVYGVDLIGAGLGCAVVVPLLGRLSGPGVVIAAGMIAAIASMLFSLSVSKTVTMRSVTALALLALLLGVQERSGLLRIDFTKDHLEEEILHEQWNALARVSVIAQGTPNWATSRVYNGPKPETLWLKIDAEAGTPIVKFDGNFETVRALQYDVSALAYALRQNAKVLIIGPGGGRDVLTALSFGNRDVTAVEINPAIISTVKETFGEYSGGLYSRPDVTMVNDEGRSYVRRSDERFDIIQASLIDTWAATSAGAYVLSENTLYTEEAFTEFIEHLQPSGILTMSRWFFKGRPIETLRLTAVAVKALRNLGADDPAAHIVVIKRSTWDWAYRLQELRDGVGTLLVKRTPWTADEVGFLRQIATDLEYDVVCAPGGEAGSNHPDFDLLIGAQSKQFIDTYPVDISPPNDDRPFFFYMIKPLEAIRTLWSSDIEQGVMQNNVRAIFVLVALLVIVLILTAICLFLPLAVKRGEPRPAGTKNGIFLFYFLCLGLGYLLVEIPLMQQFILLLGHPVHALTVVLFALLVGSGLGSFLSEKIPDRYVAFSVLAAAVIIVAYRFILPPTLAAALGMSHTARVLLSVALLAPPGIVMGMPFPSGVRVLGRSGVAMMPWVWAVNGATSVCASVLATLLAISFGYSAVLLGGATTYAVAFIALTVAGRSAPSR